MLQGTLECKSHLSLFQLKAGNHIPHSLALAKGYPRGVKLVGTSRTLLLKEEWLAPAAPLAGPQRTVPGAGHCNKSTLETGEVTKMIKRSEEYEQSINSGILYTRPLLWGRCRRYYNEAAQTRRHVVKRHWEALQYHKQDSFQLSTSH